jgi:hypothetical protein
MFRALLFLSSLTIFSFFLFAQENSRAIPNVLIVGDSIAGMYFPYAQRALKGKVNLVHVSSIEASKNNSDKDIDWDSANFIANIKPKLSSMPEIKWDLIHFNYGLHDMKRYNERGKKDVVNGSQQVGYKDYRLNTIRNIAWLKDNLPSAVLIFATTTPVTKGEKRRRIEDSPRYNKIAKKVLAHHQDIFINDLYNFTLPNIRAWQQKPRNVHYNDQGRKAQGEFIAKAILNALENPKAIKKVSATQQAYNLMVSGSNVNTLTFTLPQYNKKLANVLIYGDSISIGYTAKVQALLKDKANVYRLPENGETSSALIPKMETMRKGMEKHWHFKWDVIHFNVGLHDIKMLDSRGKSDLINGKWQTSAEQYIANMHKNIAYFKELNPNVMLIFATTTPVPSNAKKRIIGDDSKINKLARSVLSKYPEININDLSQLVKPNHAKWMSRPGNVHYNNIGSEHLAEQVSSTIEKALTTHHELKSNKEK